jgi:hypothetical protein
MRPGLCIVADFFEHKRIRYCIFDKRSERLMDVERYQLVRTMSVSPEQY